jgi:hypothetical protein
MDNLDVPSPAPAPETDAPDWPEQFESLRRLVSSALILMLVVTGSFDIFLLRQARFAHEDLKRARADAPIVGAQYNQVSGENIQGFLRKLADYGRTHPDFAPIATKYKLDELSKQAAPAPKK